MKDKTIQRWQAAYLNKEANFARLCLQEDIPEDAFHGTKG